MSSAGPIRRLLVANRGEIARRVLRAAKEAGIATVAVFSEADAGAPHAREADHAVAIGPAPARESYLSGERIVRAALDAKADAIHPGYGFLSEKAAFAKLVEDAGLAFLGPRPETLALVGRKAAARAHMSAAGVPILPGSAELADLRAAEAAADSIGYPVILKAVAGGGGIGMTVCRDAGDLRKHFDAAKTRAGSVFADDAVYLEKYLERPRHVEVQVLGDGRGEVIHLFERECSIQRRHQKVLEESPAPALKALPELRSRLLEVAREGARSLGYRSAGTLEFLLDEARGAFYFMEMNARIQVEHPVTEMVTGIDIVRAQLAIASGDDLPARQSDVRASGHAVEVRVCAEDPAKSFMPSPGLLTSVEWPSGEGVRCDWGYESGQRVTPHYDSLLAKISAHGPTREAAFERLRLALDRARVDGVKTNLGLLRRLAADAQVARGELHTGFLGERKDLLS